MKFIHRHLLTVALVMPAILGTLVASAHNETPDKTNSTHPASGHAEPFGQPGIATKATPTVKVTLSDTMRFSPDKLIFKQGETVRFSISNAGRIPHEFVLGTKEEIAEHAEMMRQMPGMTHTDASSVRVAPGKTADLVWQFSKPGKFLFACLVPGHWEAGMEGSVVVTVSEPRK